MKNNPRERWPHSSSKASGAKMLKEIRASFKMVSSLYAWIKDKKKKKYGETLNEG